MSSTSSYSKKIIAGISAVIMTATAVIGGFADNNKVSAEVTPYNGVYDIEYDSPIIVKNDSANGYEHYKYNIKITKSGTLKLTARNLYDAVLFTSKGGRITPKGEKITNDDKYTLNAGEYYIDAKANFNTADGDGEIFASFTPSGEKFKDDGNIIGTKHTVKIPSQNAKTVKVAGFFAKHSSDTRDSFKLSVPASQTGLTIELDDDDDKLYKVEVYNSSKKRVFVKDYVKKGSASSSYVKLNKGTYYLSIVNVKNPNTGYSGGKYTVKMTTSNPHVISLNTAVLNGKNVASGNIRVKAKSNYAGDKITYSSSNKNVIAVSKSGVVSFVNPGKAYLIITAKSSSKNDTVKKKVPVYVAPKKLSGFKVKKTSTSKTGVSGKITWKRDPKATGYIVKYSTKGNGKYKTYKLTSNTRNYFNVKNVKYNTTVYLKVCAYKKVGSKIITGPYFNYNVRSIRYYK